MSLGIRAAEFGLGAKFYALCICDTILYQCYYILFHGCQLLLDFEKLCEDLGCFDDFSLR